MIKRLIGYIQAFNENEIMEMIPRDTMEKIMAEDRHPRFQAYVVATEGPSSPTFELSTESNSGKEKRTGGIINWARGIIKSMVSNFKYGIPFYDNHNSANYQPDKPVIARLAGWGLKEIAGKLCTIVIAYFLSDKKEEAANYDIISMESRVELTEIGEGNYNASDVQDISGFALGSSKEWMPAFSDAKLIGSLQFFNVNIKSEKENKQDGEGRMPLTLAEIKKEIEQGGFYPNQVFDMEKLAGKVEVKEGKLFFHGGDMILQQHLKEKIHGFGVIVPEDWKTKAEEGLKKIPEYEKNLKEFSAAGTKQKLSQKIKEYATVAKLDDKQLKYLESQKRIDKFNVDATDFEAEFIKWRDAELNEYKENFELFNGKQGEENPGEPGKIKDDSSDNAFLL